MLSGFLPPFMDTGWSMARATEARCDASTGLRRRARHLSSIFPPATPSREPKDPAPAPALTVYAQEELYLFHGRDPISGNPDWLGEIFEWLSAAGERGAPERDSIGRISYEQSVFARHAISPLRPYASLIMAWFENFVNGPAGVEHLAAAPSPVSDARHLVISSHDIDFYFTGRGAVCCGL